MKITIFTKYLIKSIKMVREYSIRPLEKGEIHSRTLYPKIKRNIKILGFQCSDMDLNFSKWPSL